LGETTLARFPEKGSSGENEVLIAFPCETLTIHRKELVFSSKSTCCFVKMIARPGFEPGSRAPKAPMLGQLHYRALLPVWTRF
jgi:hypothetical protein